MGTLDLFGNEIKLLENTYNLSLKIMWDIPRETHRYFLEPNSKQVHIRFILMKRFLRFLEQIENSSKRAIKLLLSICRNDCNSITGKNLRNIMLLCNKDTAYLCVPPCEWLLTLIYLLTTQEPLLRFNFDLLFKCVVEYNSKFSYLVYITIWSWTSKLAPRRLT